MLCYAQSPNFIIIIIIIIIIKFVVSFRHFMKNVFKKKLCHKFPDFFLGKNSPLLPTIWYEMVLQIL
jgi:hypothetical protein